MSDARVAWKAVYGFSLVPFFFNPLSFHMPWTFYSFLPTLAVSLAHICPPLVLYHIEHFGLCIPQSPSLPVALPLIPSLLPLSLCMLSKLSTSVWNALSLWKHVPICPSLSLHELYTLLLFFNVSLHLAWPFPLIFQPVFLVLLSHLFSLIFFHLLFFLFLGT